MLKFFGCCLILMGAFGGALWVRGEVADHVKLLYGFQQLFFKLAEDIRYSRQPMEQLLVQNGNSSDERINGICRELGEKLAEGNVVSAQEEWETIFRKRRKELHLSEEEVELFAEAGNAFFGKCMEENETYFSLVMDRLGFQIEEQRKEQKEKQKVLQSVVLMGGAMLVLLLI